ncbi:MAG: hypothetical protein ABI643_03575 [Candidatus Doudnabacteria bacterium]
MLLVITMILVVMQDRQEWALMLWPHTFVLANLLGWTGLLLGNKLKNKPISEVVRTYRFGFLALISLLWSIAWLGAWIRSDWATQAVGVTIRSWWIFLTSRS